MKIKVIVLCIILSITNCVRVVCMDEPVESRVSFDAVIAQEEAKWQQFIAHTKNVPFNRIWEENELALFRFEKSVRENKKNALAAIKKDFFLSKQAPDLWQLYKDTIARVKAYNKGHMAREFDATSDFTGRSCKILSYIAKQLRKKGINPSSILLESSYPNQQEQCASGMLVNVKNPTIALKCSDKEKIMLNTQDIKLGQFILCPSLLKRPYEEQKAFCTSMVYWFVKQHATTKYILFKFLRHIMRMSDDNILNSSAWQSLACAQMEEAIIMPCLKKEKLMAGTWQFFNNKDSFFIIELFSQVCRAHTMLKQRAWLRDNSSLFSPRLAPIIESTEETQAAQEVQGVNDQSCIKGMLEILEKMYDK